MQTNNYSSVLSSLRELLASLPKRNLWRPLWCWRSQTPTVRICFFKKKRNKKIPLEVGESKKTDVERIKEGRIIIPLDGRKRKKIISSKLFFMSNDRVVTISNNNSITSGEGEHTGAHSQGCVFFLLSSSSSHCLQRAIEFGGRKEEGMVNNSFFSKHFLNFMAK